MARKKDESLRDQFVLIVIKNQLKVGTVSDSK